METEKMEQLYQKIAEHLNEIIPSEMGEGCSLCRSFR